MSEAYQIKLIQLCKTEWKKCNTGVGHVNRARKFHLSYCIDKWFRVQDRWKFWYLCSSLLVVPYYTHDHKARRWVALSIILVPLKIMEVLQWSSSKGDNSALESNCLSKVASLSQLAHCSETDIKSSCFKCYDVKRNALEWYMDWQTNTAYYELFYWYSCFYKLIKPHNYPIVPDPKRWVGRKDTNETDDFL